MPACHRPRPIALLRAALLLAAAFASAGAPAAGPDRLREQEIAQCLPEEIATWGDGADRPMAVMPTRWIYRHDGAPPWFDAAAVQAAIGRAAEAWSQCGSAGLVQVDVPGQALAEGAVLVQWSDAGSRGNFGLAHLGTRTLSLGPAAFRLLDARNPAYPARETLQMVLSHEMGHFFGLMDHSRRCVDVMSYYVNGQGERCRTRGGALPVSGRDYRALLPTACDIARCRGLYQQTVSRAP